MASSKTPLSPANVTKNLPPQNTIKGGFINGWPKAQDLRVGKWTV